MNKFEKHNGYSRTFQENKLTLGLFFPIEAYRGSVPEMDLEEQITLAQKAEQAHFASLFVRDVPLNDPSFGDAGQMFDPWIFLSFIAAHTDKISLGTGSVVTTLRHPLNVAKSAASLDRISKQRLLFGIATGDRPIEFTSYRIDREQRANRFQEALYVMKEVWANTMPQINKNSVQLKGADLLPKPALFDIPTLVTGYSGQSIEWIAKNSDGWINYPLNPNVQGELITDWRSLTEEFKPFAQSLYIDLVKDPFAGPTPIHLGFRSGHQFLIDYLKKLEAIGVNHVILNVKFAERPIRELIEELGEKVIPHFPALTDL